MIYDNTQVDFKYDLTQQNPTGYAIHAVSEEIQNITSRRKYELYTDDGRGNGDFICESNDYYWIERIARALDSVDLAKI